MFIKLTKSQKTIARMLINKGLNIECDECLRDIQSELLNGKKNNLSNHDIYIKIYTLIHKFDKHLDNRYDDITGSDDVLTTEDIANFDNDDIQNNLIALKKDRLK